jgi:hypothetical protein
LRSHYLRGVDLGAALATPSGDVLLQTALQAVINDVQSVLGIRFARQVIKTYPDASLVQGVDFDLLGEPLMYFKAAPTAQHFTIPLPYSNVESIQRVRLFYGNPTGNPQTRALYTVPADWILFTSKEGVLRINPSITNAVLQSNNFGGNVLGFESVYYTFFWRQEIPGVWAIDYTIGHGQVDVDVARYIGLRAAIQVLGLAGAARDVGAGLASESLGQDGISESISHVQGRYGPYSGLIQVYTEELERIDLKQKRMAKKGLKVAVW